MTKRQTDEQRRRTCPICEEVFIRSGRGRVTYCSETCRRRSERSQWASQKGSIPKPPRSLGLRPIATSCASCCRLVTVLPVRKTSEPQKPNVCDVCRKDYTAQYYKKNRGVMLAQTVARTTRVQNETRDVASKHGQMWTGPELEIATREDLSAREAAFLLGRTLAAVYGQRRLCRIDPDKRHLLIGVRFPSP